MGNCIDSRPATWVDDEDEEWESRSMEEEEMVEEKKEQEKETKEVKIKITKKQLELLLQKADVQALPVQQLLERLVCAAEAGLHDDGRHWRPALQSIPEVAE